MGWGLLQPSSPQCVPRVPSNPCEAEGPRETRGATGKGDRSPGEPTSHPACGQHSPQPDHLALLLPPVLSINKMASVPGRPYLPHLPALPENGWSELQLSERTGHPGITDQ